MLGEKVPAARSILFLWKACCRGICVRLFPRPLLCLPPRLAWPNTAKEHGAMAPAAFYRFRPPLVALGRPSGFADAWSFSQRLRQTRSRQAAATCPDWRAVALRLPSPFTCTKLADTSKPLPLRSQSAAAYYRPAPPGCGDNATAAFKATAWPANLPAATLGTEQEAAKLPRAARAAARVGALTAGQARSCRWLPA